ncbi:GNAT family N-acetyltransferase [Bacillus pseudomycoides]|uniref:GNAT family N-acetyltransferase n=1 Tax=Bacillus pseudomycoides TaxID=64104 RepID=A0AA91ZTC7_9BACI|nr:MULTISPECIES: GNAT family N-acetyltransferase [Bacillus]PEB51391.1 GNAT family N-acetyltransferase [Bacillus sp. AFS098217]PED82645.1 GNAT family N-acetyltransferase [Bacillus pseudomycoides]PEU12065.1 GNAT family N-acetyltransferase [Bacillus sp. AFS014408]PEU17751.1 GNAT family N-acetyltransferase [Bacillus sp. AFS019443]PFW60873.1 GNAT family N-acetyltransferase [Bacillus sp. AFS075034]
MGTQFATLEDLDWINTQYQSVGFVPSNLKQDKVAIITYNGEQAGLGRLVYIDEQTIEMGGIYILPKYRGYKLAGELVSFLVQTAKQLQVPHVYCIPFEELEAFYKKYGFKEVHAAHETVHPNILNKYNWCLQEYDKNVLLFKL